MVRKVGLKLQGPKSCENILEFISKRFEMFLPILDKFSLGFEQLGPGETNQSTDPGKCNESY